MGEGPEGNGNRWISIGELLGSLVLLVSALWLPWATVRAANHSVTFQNGRLDVLVVACGAISLGLAAVSLTRGGRSVFWLQLSFGVLRAWLGHLPWHRQASPRRTRRPITMLSFRRLHMALGQVWESLPQCSL